MGRTILGPAEKVKKFDRRDLSDFVSENYSPDRLILAAAGGVKHEEIVSLAKEQFGSLKSNKIKWFFYSSTSHVYNFSKKKITNRSKGK